MTDFEVYEAKYSDFEISIYDNNIRTIVQCQTEDLIELKRQIDERLGDK